MAYTTIDDPTIYFNTILYTGDGSTSNAITGLDFSPNWVWIKRRNNANPHFLNDSVRGATKDLTSDDTDAETTNNQYGILKSFDSNGFTVSVGSTNGARANTSGGTFVSWNWKAGTSFSNDASATSVGTIDSTGSINTTAGFSIISYTGTGSAGTIAHGLGAVPTWYFIKQRNTTGGWIVYHKGNTSSPETDYLRLDKNDTTVDDAIFNDTAPTSSVFSIGTNAPVNTNGGTYIAYCFADVKGYSKFGGYTGNGNADGTFVYTGFKPAWLIIKKTADVAESWFHYDNKREDHAGNDRYYALRPDKTSAENTTYGDNWQLDFLSNGFKLRTTAGHLNNGSFIYMCFAESPFTNSNGIPNNAE